SRRRHPGKALRSARARWLIEPRHPAWTALADSHSTRDAPIGSSDSPQETAFRYGYASCSFRRASCRSARVKAADPTLLAFCLSLACPPIHIPRPVSSLTAKALPGLTRIFTNLHETSSL